VAATLSRELGQPCLAIEGQAVAFQPRSRALLACFLNGLGGAQALAICGHDLAILLVGARQNTHPAKLQEALRAAQLEAESIAHLRTLLSPLGALLGPPSQGLVLGEIVLDPLLPRRPDVDAVLFAPASRLDLQVTLQGYGTGQLGLLSC
jgi:hypothetical protein